MPRPLEAFVVLVNPTLLEVLCFGLFALPVLVDEVVGLELSCACEVEQGGGRDVY